MRNLVLNSKQKDRVNDVTLFQSKGYCSPVIQSPVRQQVYMKEKSWINETLRVKNTL